MIILDKPYVSEFLKNTLIENKIPVLKSKNINALNLPEQLNFFSEEEFIYNLKNNYTPVLTNSENSIDWITRNLDFTFLPEKINLFKNKVRFRQLLQPMYPDLFFQEVEFDELKTLNIAAIQKPFIIKPHVGFFSFGVYKIHNQTDWDIFIDFIYNKAIASNKIYPEVVINSSKFIIEQNISGTEFAVDAYYNSDGEPVILNILKHIFSSDDNFDDRVYSTSKEIIEEYHDKFYNILKEIGEYIDLKMFPLHAEFRINKNDEIIPIEINPMRFAGICVTDIAYYAYGLNIYSYYFNQQKPIWEEILEGKDNKTYNVILASIPSYLKAKEIESFDYEKFISNFQKPIEARKMDYKKNNVFCILFLETDKNNWQEIEYILHSDLKEFINLK